VVDGVNAGFRFDVVLPKGASIGLASGSTLTCGAAAGSGKPGVRSLGVGEPVVDRCEKER